DRPEASTFANPAVVDTDALTITLGGGDASPGVLRRLREDLEALFASARFVDFVRALKKRRDALPRGERATKMRELIHGFPAEARLHFPDWFEAGYARRR